MITLFEITTAAAFLAFAETPADLLLLETGLGGRLDATNVVAKPLLTAITPVSIDHVSFLGETLTEIAGEKAGIIKQGVPCVVGRQEREAFAVIEAEGGRAWRAASCGRARLRHYEQHGRLVFQTADGLLDLPLPRLNGRHQIDNAGNAIAAASLVFGEALNHARDRARAHACANGRRAWSGCPRAASMLMSPTAPRSGSTAGTIAAGGQVIAHALAELDDRLPRPVHLICGMMETKDAHAFIAPFKGLVERIYTVPIPEEPNAFDAEALAEIARAEGFDVVAARACRMRW